MSEITEAYAVSLILDCVDDWRSCFIATAEFDHEYNCRNYFDCTLMHEQLGEKYSFRIKVSQDGYAEMDYADDSWNMLTTSNLFAWMWFESAQRRPV